MNRYHKQMLVKQLGPEGQKKLGNTTIGIVGVGALGCVVAELLCRAGVKKLVLIDHDVVEEDNLHRQFLYCEQDIGKVKVEIAKKALEQMNKKVKIQALGQHLSERNCAKLLKGCDMFVDCTDHLETRFAMNSYGRQAKIPWIFGAIAGTQGLVFTVLSEGPCFSCIFERVQQGKDCQAEGILATTASIVASMQVVALFRLITESKTEPTLYVIDTWNSTTEAVKVSKKIDCTGCAGEQNQKSKDSTFSVEFCDTRAAYEIKPSKNVTLDLHAIKKHFNDIIVETPIVLVLRVEGEEIIVHNYGNVLVKECKDIKKIKRIGEKLYYYRSK